METEPRKIFLVANAEQMVELNADSLSRRTVAAGRVCARWALQSSSESQPSLAAPSQLLLTQGQHQPPKKKPGATAGLLPPTCTPRGGALQAFLWCRITISDMQLKTGNAPDTWADTEKQRPPSQSPVLGVPPWLVSALHILSHENPAGHSKPTWPKLELNWSGPNIGQIKPEVKWQNVWARLLCTGVKEPQNNSSSQPTAGGGSMEKHFKWNSELLCHCSHYSCTIWIVPRTDLAMWNINEHPFEPQFFVFRI